MPIVTRRRKQKGEGEHKKRMETAVQAILPLGFSRDLIFNTIQHLLQVYGGQRSWAFIEEESYKLVVDTILEGEEPCSPKAGALDERETKTEHIDIDLVDVNLSEDKTLAEEDTELEGGTGKADKKFVRQECMCTEQVIPTENQLCDISISNGNLTRKNENQFGNSNVCADGDGALTYKRDIGISSASEAEFDHYSSNRAGEVDRDVGLKISDPLDDTSGSLKTEVTCQKGLYAGKTKTESLESSVGCNIDEDNRVGEVDRDVGLKISGPLDDTPDSFKAEGAFQKGLYVGKTETECLEASLGSNIDEDNAWQRTGKDKVQSSMLAGIQEGLEQRDNVDTEVFSCTSYLLEAEKSEKNEKIEESKKHGKEHGERLLLCDLPKDVSSFSHSLGKTSEPCVIGTTTVFSWSQNTDTNSLLKENVMQETCQILPEQCAGQISRSRGYADSSWTTSLPRSGLQRQEIPLYSSNLHSFPHRNSSSPLKRKGCFGWLSDDESSPESSDTARLVNEDFCKVKEIGSDTMTTVEGVCSLKKKNSGKNVEHEKNIMLSNEKQLLDKSSSEFDCKISEEDTRRLADCFFRPWMNLSKDIGDTCIGDKYEQTDAGKSVQKILAKLQHENELYDNVNCKSSKLQMDESTGVSRLKTSHKLQSSHDGYETYRSDHMNSRIDGMFTKLEMDESIGGSRLKASHDGHETYRSDRRNSRIDDGHETYRSDHRNSRIDGKHSWQPTNNNSSYNLNTKLPQSLKDYQRGEPRRKYWENQVRTISKQHLGQGISGNREANFREGHYRKEDERNSEKAKIISYNKKERDGQDYGREKEKESVKVINKTSSPYEKKGFQDPKNAHNHYHESGKVGDEFHSPNKRIALPHAHFRNNYDALQPPKLRKISRWDVKPDFIK